MGAMSTDIRYQQVLCWTCNAPLITTDPSITSDDGKWIKMAPWRCPKGCEEVLGPPATNEEPDERHALKATTLREARDTVAGSTGSAGSSPAPEEYVVVHVTEDGGPLTHTHKMTLAEAVEFEDRLTSRYIAQGGAMLCRVLHDGDSEFPVERLLRSPAPLAALGVEIREVNVSNGWNVPTQEDWDDPHRIPTFLCLIHSEASEALEGFRIDDRENVAEELADVLIRVLDLSHGLGIDMDAEVAAKLAKNRTRGIRHGGVKQV